MPISKKFKCIKDKINNLSNREEKYQFIIDLGRKLSDFDNNLKTEENLVTGCQSEMYLYTFEENSKFYFKLFSDAFISKGLAGILINIFEGEVAEDILKFDSKLFTELSLENILSPSRSNGFYQILTKLKKDVLKIYQKNLLN